MSLNNFKAVACLVAFSLVGIADLTKSVAATITLSANRDNTILQTSYSADTPPQQLNDVNVGAIPYTQVGTAGGNDTNGRVRHITGFDESAMPAFSQINSVTLRMFHWNLPGATDLGGATPFTIEVHAISAANADWVEGTGVGGPTGNHDSGSNWNRKSEPGLLNWAGGTGTPATGGLTMPGVDYEVTALASQTFNSVPADGAAVDWVFTGSSAALTALIAGWDSTNPGLVLFHVGSTGANDNKRLFFHTREAVDFNLRPQLIINFEEPLPAPEPSSIALLGLGLVFVAKRRRR